MILFLFLVGFVIGTAVAQVQETATQAFDAGREAFEAANYKKAATDFRRAYQLKPSWKLLYNIGQAEATAKQYGLALTTFEKYLATGGDDVGDARNAEVQAELHRLRSLVGFVEVIAPEGASVVVDEVDRGVPPLPGRLKMTASVKHHMVITKDDTVILDRQVTVSGQESITVEVDVDSAEPTVTGATDQNLDTPSNETNISPEPTLKGPKRLKTMGAVLLGVSAAALIGATITGIKALSINNDLEKECEVNSFCASDNSDKLHSQDVFSTTSTILMTVGGVALVTGVVLLVAGKKKQESTALLQLVPVAGDCVMGVGLTGRFYRR